MAKELSEQQVKQLANERLLKFKEECLAAGIPAFSMGENTKLKSAFMKTLAPDYGARIKDATFKELASDLYGSGLPTIEEYLTRMDGQSFESAGFGTEKEKAAEEKAEQPRKAGRKKKAEQREAPAEEATPQKAEEPAKPDTETEEKKPGRKRKEEAEQLPAKRSSNLDVLVTPSTVRSVDRTEITRLKRLLSQLLYEKDCEHRQLTLYRRDMCILDALTEYGKKKSVDLSVDGTSLDSRVNVLHAAISLLVKELDAQGADECFAFLKKAIAQEAEEDEYRDQKIAEIRAKLKEYEP